MKSVSAFLMIFFVTFFIFTFESPAVQYDPEVYRVQKELKARGYDPGPLDGLLGRSTRNALKQFQKDIGLPITGMLDQQTKTKLGIISSKRGIVLKKVLKERRLALVIGNGTYQNAPLNNPVNDANDMASVLKKLSFDVILETNANKRAMLIAIDQFGKRLRNAKVGLFFFAGHGLQVKGINYLIPIGAYVTNETDVEIEGLDVRRILGRMEMAGNDVNIILFDACRNNPFKRSFRSTTQGLAKIDAPKGMFIVYATSPGNVAADGEGRNSPFTKGLLEEITLPNIPIEKLIKNVRRRVLIETNEKQMPWQSSSLIGDFYFASSGAIIDKPSIGASLYVESNIEDATVLVDDRKVGTTPLPVISLSAGKHIVLVEKPGYEIYKKRINVEPGRTVSLYVQMSASVEQSGRLFVDTEPEDAGVRILNLGAKFYQGIELDKGRYQLEVLADGYENKTLWITLRADEDNIVAIRLERITGSGLGDRVTNSLDMEFVYLPPGTFMMGSPENERVRLYGEKQQRVTLTKGFYMMTTEVTQGQWEAVMGNNPSHFKNCGSDCPVDSVSWYDVQEFIRTLNDKEGTDRYRLPTEAEWEYAARAGSTTAFPNGDISELECGHDPNLNAIGWYCGNSGGRTHPVAQKKPNAWGLYDMHGNVIEWCHDLSDVPFMSPEWKEEKGGRAKRGCNFNHQARACRSAFRGSGNPNHAWKAGGFRLAKTGN